MAYLKNAEPALANFDIRSAYIQFESAYENFQKLGDLKFITSDELKKWEKIIGLRNILVHDYLKVNREVIKSVLKKKEYLFIQDFVQISNLKLKFAVLDFVITRIWL